MTGPRRTRPMTLVSLCVIALLLAATLAPLSAATAPAGSTQPEVDNTVTRIEVQPSGAAQWTIQIRTRLDTDERVSEYEAFQERFRENTSRYLDPFRERMQGVVANAANVTGREMRAVDFAASTSIQEVPRRWGIVTYEFTWTRFAAVQNDSLAVGDVFQGGFFLAANDTLEIEAPAGHELTRVDPEPASRADGVVTWLGREDFADRRPRVVLSPTTATEHPDQGATTPAGATSPLFGDDRLGVVLVGLLLLALGVLGAYIGWRRRDESPEPEPTGAASATAAGGERTESKGTADSGAETAPDETLRDEIAADETATAATAADETTVDQTASEPPVLTDTERVTELLEANDGRLRQGEIADEFDWSASKTSRVVGKMVDAGSVQKLRLGRENLIELEDTED